MGTGTMIEIDGSYGEGGGQILRTSLSLSCVLGLSFRISDIRKSRKPPGLRPQHLMAVNAARAVGGADVTGSHVGSRDLIFKPHDLRGGNYRFDVGTAGSISLILQTLIPPLVHAPTPSTVDLIGGTHVTFSPSFHYLQNVFLPMLQKLGCEISLRMENAGFYPRGGGRIRMEIHGRAKLNSLYLTRPGSIKAVSGFSVVSNLPEHIAIRQMESAKLRLAFLNCPMNIRSGHLPSPGHGSFIILLPDAPPAVAGFEGLGERGKPAERVGMEAADKLAAWAESGAAMDKYLADQLVLYLALSGQRSVLTTEEITNHLLTNLWVVSKFYDFLYKVDGKEGRPGTVLLN